MPATPIATSVVPCRQARPKESLTITAGSWPKRSPSAARMPAADASGSSGSSTIHPSPGAFDLSTPALAQTKPCSVSAMTRSPRRRRTARASRRIASTTSSVCSTRPSALDTAFWATTRTSPSSKPPARSAASPRSAARSSPVRTSGSPVSGMTWTLGEAPALEVGNEGDQEEEGSDDPVADEFRPTVDVVNEEAEVLAEEAGDENQRQSERRNDGEPLDDDVEPVRDRREIHIHRAREQILVAVDQFGDTDEVVEDVAKVTLGLGVAPRQDDHPAEELAGEVPLRSDDASQSVQAPLHANDLLQLLGLRTPEDLILDRIDIDVVVLEGREEAVREAVEQAVEDDDRPLELARLLGVALAEVVAGRRVLAPHGDEVVLGIEE